MNWILKLLPQETRQLIVLGQRIVACLDTPEERRAAVQYGIGMFVDGKVEITDWARFGSRLGVLKAPKYRPRKPKVVK